MKQRNVRSTNKAVIMIACLCLVLVAVLSVLVDKGYVQSIKRLVRSTTAGSISELTASKAQYLDERIRAEQLALHSLADSLETEDDIFSKPDLLTKYCERRGATCVWVVDTRGNFWNTRQDQELTPAQKDLFKSALSGEENVSNVYIGQFGKRQILFQIPIYQNGQVAGGIYESYPVEMLQNTYGGSTYNDAGYSYVLGTDGSIVLAPVRYSYLQIYDNFQDVLKDGENSPEAVSVFMNALQSGQKGTATFDFEGETQFLSFTPLQEKEGWHFVTVIPLSMVEKDGTVIMDLTVRMAVMIVLVIVFALALGLIILYYRNKKRRDYDMYIRDTYGAISQNIDTVIFIVDSRTGKVEYAFENSLEILGIPASTFSGPDSSGRFEEELRTLLRERPEQKIMWERPLYNDVLGRQMWLKVTALPVKLHGVCKYIFAATDVTQDRQIRENLNTAVAAAEQANASKSLFLSNMSHDIRTPMNAITGMSKLAELHIDDKERVRDCLHKIDISSRHLLNLINEVLDMSKIESGKMTLSMEPFSLPELVEGDIAIAQQQCRSKGQTLIVDTKDIRHEHLEGDSLRLNQVLLNMISNAVKFTPEKGTITFSIEELPQKHPRYAAYRFKVSDTGIGIDPEFMPKLFRPFERESTKTVNRTEGTGLGLAIARNIVEAMGGQIYAESRKGQGTTFTVELELKLQQGTEEEVAYVRALDGLRALVVCGSPKEREQFETYLKDCGMETDSVISGREAVENFREGKCYHLVLMDITPDESVQAAEQIRALAGDGPKVVMVAAYDSMETVTEGRCGEIDAVLQKPIFRSTLCQKLAGLFSVRESAASKQNPEDTFKGRRFLLVEDNELNREIATELLELYGAAVDSAVDGKAGVEAFEGKEAGYYDVIFMDIQMPVMDGYEAARHIRASGHPQARSVPIIAMSANMFTEDVRACLESGMNSHVGKPIDMDEIILAVNTCLAE